jgi:hypothetical protein
MDWLGETVATVAERTGFHIDDLVPSPDERRALLDIARVAAHTSGERTNAPLLCYVLGRAVERGLSLEQAIAAVTKG